MRDDPIEIALPCRLYRVVEHSKRELGNARTHARTVIEQIEPNILPKATELFRASPRFECFLHAADMGSPTRLLHQIVDPGDHRLYLLTRAPVRTLRSIEVNGRHV